MLSKPFAGTIDPMVSTTTNKLAEIPYTTISRELAIREGSPLDGVSTPKIRREFEHRNIVRENVTEFAEYLTKVLDFNIDEFKEGEFSSTSPRITSIVIKAKKDFEETTYADLFPKFKRCFELLSQRRSRTASGHGDLSRLYYLGERLEHLFKKNGSLASPIETITFGICDYKEKDKFNHQDRMVPLESFALTYLVLNFLDHYMGTDKRLGKKFDVFHNISLNDVPLSDSLHSLAPVHPSLETRPLKTLMEDEAASENQICGLKHAFLFRLR